VKGLVGVKNLFLFLGLLCISMSASGMATTPAPKEPVATAPKSAAPVAVYVPPPPPDSPKFPNPFAGQNQGAPTPPPEPPPILNEVRPPLQNFVFNVQKPPVLPKKAADPLRLIFPGRGKTGYRSNAYFDASQVAPPGKINDFQLFLLTLLHEAQNDARIAKHEHELDQINLELHRKIHAMHEALVAKKAISPMEFEASKTKVEKLVQKSLESKARWQEFRAEQHLTSLRIGQTQGKVVPVGEMARAYERIWECRVEKVQAAEAQAKADADYFDYVLAIQTKLFAAKAGTKEDVIRAQRDSEDAHTVLKLAGELVEANIHNQHEMADIASASDKADGEATAEPTI
jgi:hypothetical protein